MTDQDPGDFGRRVAESVTSSGWAARRLPARRASIRGFSSTSASGRRAATRLRFG